MCSYSNKQDMCSQSYTKNKKRRTSGVKEKANGKCELKTEQREEKKILLNNCECSRSPRSISIAQLNTLLHLHLRPIKLVVFK